MVLFRASNHVNGAAPENLGVGKVMGALERVAQRGPLEQFLEGAVGLEEED